MNGATLRNIAVVKESRGASVVWTLIGRGIASDRHARIAKFANVEEANAALTRITSLVGHSTGKSVVFDATCYRRQESDAPRRGDRDIPCGEDGF